MQAGGAPTVPATSEDRPENPISIRCQTAREAGTCRVLVVADILINCQEGDMPEKPGCHADAAGSGHDAIEMHGRQRYDLIFMDYRMPDMDGSQTGMQIRATETGGIHAAIFGRTSTLSPGSREKCIASGMDDLMTKPLCRKMARELVHSSPLATY